MTPYELLERYPDRTRPWVTFYDGTESRIELSVASVANAVAKAASMLRDGLGLEPGARVSIDLPRHWQLPVWIMAALSVGAQVGRDLAGPADVRIVGPAALESLAAGADLRADEVLVSSCDAFGLPIPGGVPSGIIDIGLEVRGYPDSFSPEPAAADAAALLADGEPAPWSGLVPGATVPAGARLWVDESTRDGDLIRLVAIDPLLVGGSVVIGVGLDAEQSAAIRGTESAKRP